MPADFIATNLFNLLLGLALGAAGGMLGIGGGLIAIPILGYLYGMDQHLAQGTALVMIVPNVLIGVYRYHQKNPIHLRAVATISIFSMIATYFSARLVAHVDASHLRVAFAIFLIGLAIYFGSQIRTVRGTQNDHAGHAGQDSAQQAHHVFPKAALPVLGVMSGAMSGIFTVGSGLVVVPLLVSYFRMTQARAQGMALALVVPGAVIALGTYSGAGHVDWRTGIPLAIGGIVSVSWGVHLAHTLPQNILKTLFCAFLLVTALSMLVLG